MCVGTLFLFIFSLILSAVWIVYADCSDHKIELQNELKLFKNLTCAYSSHYRPVKDHKTVINVKLRFDIKYLTFDTDKETITIHSRVFLTWKDELLTWDPIEYGNIEQLLVDTSDIWLPGIVLYNADRRSHNSGYINSKCLLTNDGTVLFSPHLSRSVICIMALKYWPFDEQQCTFYFGAWMHTGEQVNFAFYQSMPIVLDEFQNAPGWKLLKVDHDYYTVNFTCCPNSTNQMLKYTFLLRREAVGLVASVIIPSLLAVLLTLSSFLLGLKDNTRLIVVCFSLLIHFAILIEISYLMKKLSADTPNILLFVRDSMFVALFGILTTLLLMSFKRKSVPPPTFIAYFNRFVSRLYKNAIFTDFGLFVGVELKLITEEGVASSNDERACTDKDKDWIKFANVITTCVLVISIVVYLVLICIYIPSGHNL